MIAKSLGKHVILGAFLTCKRKVAPGESLHTNLCELIDAAKTLWQRMKKGVVTVNGQVRPMNGEVAMSG